MSPVCGSLLNISTGLKSYLGVETKKWASYGSSGISCINAQEMYRRSSSVLPIKGLGVYENLPYENVLVELLNH